MKIRIFSLLVILILLFNVNSCKQVKSPFSSDFESEEQASNSESSNKDVSSKSQIEDLRLIKTEREDTSLGKNLQAKYESRFSHEHLNKYANEGNIRDKGTNSMMNKAEFSNKADLQLKEKNGFKGISNPTEKNKKADQELYVRIQPDKWNINWEHSQGLVTVRITGKRFEDINPDSISLFFSEGVGITESFMSEIRGSSFIAKFLKKYAIGIIPDPQPGDTYEIGITGEFKDGSSFGSLFDTIMIVGEKSDEEEPDDEETDLSLEIFPDEWDLSWSDSNSHTANKDNGEDVVIARISGQGFENIIQGSLAMAYGVCGEANGLSSITPVFEEKEEDCYVAKFLQSEAIGLIPDPEEGAMHQIHVTGNLEGGETFCLSHSIIIVGEDEEVELSLNIKPDKWNTAWAKNDDSDDGEIMARISGEGFDEIDPESVIMRGPGGDEISPSGTEYSGSFFQAGFSQSEAIRLISDPQVGAQYEIHIIGTLGEGSSFDLAHQITIKGKKK